MPNTTYAGTVITTFRAPTDFVEAGATWLVCDGRWFNNSAYPALATALSGRYGASGTSQFGLPDIRGYTIMCADTSTQRVILGPGASGTGQGTIQPSAMTPHAHFYALGPGSPEFVNSAGSFVGVCPTNTPGGPAQTTGMVLEPSGVSKGLYSTPSGTDVGTAGQDLQVAHVPVVAFVRAD